MKAVRRLFRPRLDQASREREALSALFRVFRLPASPSTKREGLNGRDVGRHPGGLAGTEKDGERGQNSGGHKDQGVGRDVHRNVLVGHCQHPHHLRKRRPPTKKPRSSPRGMPMQASHRALAVDEAADLLAAHADGTVQAVAADVLHDGDVKNIVDQQVPTEDEEDHQGRPHGQHRQGGGGVGDGVHHGGQELAALASSGSPPTLRAQSSMASWRPTVLVATMSDQ